MRNRVAVRLLSVLLGGLLLLAWIAPVLAIDDPYDMQVLGVYVYEDCLEDGDTGVLIHYLIDYTVAPNETATQAFLFIFMDTDGITQLKAAAPYPYVDYGYGYGMSWIYFTAAETASHGLDSDDSDLYSVLLTGNPLVPSGWTGDPPTASADIDYWQTTGDTSVLLALRVLYFANELELAWGINMLEATAVGSRLTDIGADYFTNVIPGLIRISPTAFSSAQYRPLDPDIDYVLEFRATVTSGTATVTGSPVTLSEGENTVAVTSTGSIVATLANGTIGTATNGTGVVTGAPVDLVAGTNTLTVTSAGNITFDVELNTTQTMMTGTITGTGWDLTDLAILFGMSRMWMSTVVWSVVTLLVCAAVYKKTNQGNVQSAGKVTFFVFNGMFLGGIVIGMVPVVAGVLIFLGCDAFIGYILFFKPANL